MSYEDALWTYSELKENEESHMCEVPKRVRRHGECERLAFM